MSHYRSQFIKSFAIWMEGECSWLSSNEWDLSPKIDHTSTLSILVAYHKKWKIQITVLQERSAKDLENVMTVIVKNQSDTKKTIKLIFHCKFIGESVSGISFVAPSEQSIMQHNEGQLTLVSSQFNRQQDSQLAVGKKEKIWNEQEGRLAIAPLCRDGRESMIVTNVELDSWQEIYGRIWEVSGYYESDVYAKHKKQKAYDQLKRAAERTL